MRSPAASRSTSPAASWSKGTSRSTGSAPSSARRTTVAVVSTSARSASTVREERCSCRNRITAAITIIAVMLATPEISPLSANTASSTPSTNRNGVRKAAVRRRAGRAARGAVTWFAPSRASRASASRSVSPRGPVSSARSTSSGLRPPSAASAAVVCGDGDARRDGARAGVFVRGSRSWGIFGSFSSRTARARSGQAGQALLAGLVAAVRGDRSSEWWSIIWRTMVATCGSSTT